MITAHPECPPALTLCKRWVATYNRYLSQVAALQFLYKPGAKLGLFREQLQEQATQLTDLADQLLALGYRPHERFAGAEARLWAETLRMVNGLAWQTPPHDLPMGQVAEDIGRMNGGWERFAGFVAQLPADFYDHLPSLNPEFLRGDSLLRLVGARRQPTANGVRPDHVV